jgi:hypothetical protein
LTDQAEPFQRGDTTGWIPLAIGLSAVVLVWDLLELPELLNFITYAFGDQGSNLTIAYLASHGYRPVIDFGYTYGLLGVIADVAWSRLVGLTPVGYEAGAFVCQIVAACAIARTARALALKPIQLIFLFVAIGRAVVPTNTIYWNFAHPLEAVLICFAVAEQARGARANALALTTAAVFAKPSMGFVYSALLLSLMALDLHRRRTATLTAWFNQLKSAAMVGISLCAILGIAFGVDVLWRTALPISGMAAYRAVNAGFFTGIGSAFWYFPGVNWHYYVGTMISLWVAATVYLVWSAIPAARRVWKNLGTKSDFTEIRRDEIVLSCALLHLAYVFFFFGSWNYYCDLLIVGAAAASIERRLHRAALCAIIVIAAASWYGLIKSSIYAWRNTSRSPVTANLWSSPQVRDEWSKILALSNGRRTAVVHYAGAVEILFPEFEPPVGTYYQGGLLSPAESQREAARIESADLIVVPTLPDWPGAAMTPETERAMARFKRTEKGAYFSVYQRQILK